jgi:hypothetical protein
VAADARKLTEIIVRQCQTQGADVRRTKNNHWRITPPGSRGFTLSSTPGGRNRSIENAVASLRRAGLKIDI